MPGTVTFDPLLNGSEIELFSTIDISNTLTVDFDSDGDDVGDNTEEGDADTILDFTAGTDLIDLGSNTDFDSFEEVLAVATQQGQDTILDFGGGNTLTLEGVILSDLTADDFGFDVMG